MERALHLAGNRLIKYSGVLIVLILWEVAPRMNETIAFYLPPLSKVILTILDLFQNEYLFMNIMVSLWRVLIGLIFATILGAALGILLGFYWENITPRCMPLFRIFSQINPYALYPLFVAVLGIGENGKIGIVFWTAVWPVLFHSITGAKAADAVLVKTAKSMGISRRALFCKVLLPQTLPSIFQGVRIGVEVSFFILIAAEMTGTTVGLGYMVHLSGYNYVIPELYAAGLCIICLSLALNKSVLWIKNKLYFWKSENVRPFNIWNIIGILLVLVFILIVGAVEIQNSRQFLMNNVIFEG